MFALRGNRTPSSTLEGLRVTTTLLTQFARVRINIEQTPSQYKIDLFLY